LLARYAVADSPWSDRTAIYRLVLDDFDSENWALDWSGAYFARGPAGHPYLAVSAIPLNTTNVQLVGSPSPRASNTVIWMVRNLPISSFTNGVCLLPGDFLAAAGDLTTNGWFARTVDAKGVTTSMASVAPLWYSSIPYFDGREQMRDNLSFLLQTADLGYGTMQVSLGDPGYPHTDVSCPWDYVYSGFYHFDADGLGMFTQDEFGPFVCNNIYRNFVFTPSDVYGSSAGNLAGVLATGLYDWGGPYSIIHPNPKYAFQAPATVTNIPSLLAPAQTPWTCRYPDWSGNLYLGAPGCDRANS
jgi:hypothetical protein